MWYLIHARDRENSLDARLGARPLHLARMKTLTDEGRLLTAGPLPAIDAEDPGPAGFLGSVIIARFESLESARAWAEQDPYIECGAWESVEVFPFKRVLP